MEWNKAKDIENKIGLIVRKLNLGYIESKKIICFRSLGSSSRARARIWSFPRVWQLALNLGPYYVIEVLSQYFDKLSPDDQTRVLIHELLHIPKNFSGSLLPHRGRGKRIDERRVENLFQQLKDK
ncbi:metallopeptidase [Candidatus Gottesmanbacteria bacterium]|nr:metallopeptidase [Candidatus Gottesmanbacteria bacterium]